MATEVVDRYVRWEPEIEGGEEEHVDSNLQPSPERPISEVDTIRISRKAVLADLVKSLGGNAPVYGIRRTGTGFNGHVKAKVPETRGSTKLCDWYGSSNASFSTKDHAEEQAAEGLIKCLKRSFNFEVDEINWLEKNQYDNDRSDAREEIRKLERENGDLKDVVDRLKFGWSTTLSLLESVHRYAGAARSPPFPGFYTPDPSGSMEDVSRLEEYIGKALRQGAKGFNSVGRMEEHMEKQRGIWG